jgi:hypothetical protein
VCSREAANTNFKIILNFTGTGVKPEFNALYHEPSTLTNYTTEAVYQ